MSALYDRALGLLRRSLKSNQAQFREHQWESISTLVEDRGRLLVVQRTGWGKSAVYFIAAKLLREESRGPTIIISPLLALMRNQIVAAAAYGVRLGTINSANSSAQNERAETELLENQLDAIIISPERLANARFVEDVLQRVAETVGLFVVDEAHCISDWGHDFRPDYKRIRSILKSLPPKVPVLATTATANKRVTNDVAVQLGGRPKIFRGQLTRESLQLQCLCFSKRSGRLAWLADTLPKLDGTGIVYTSTKRDAELVAAWLRHRGISAEAYHAGGGQWAPDQQRERSSRRKLEDDLMNNRVKALVATSALGMGYDKPDLAFVIHFQSPGSVVSYYQQVGRAGRGIPKAYGVLLSGKEDNDIQEYFIRNAFPDEALVKEVLDLLESSQKEAGLTVREITGKVNGRPKKVMSAIKFLAAESPAPIVVNPSTINSYKRTLLDYQIPREVIQRISDIKMQEWRSMQEYLHHDGCLMRYLAHHLDDERTGECGKCANCSPESALSKDYDRATAVAASEFMANEFVEVKPKKRFGSKAEVAARFPRYKFKPNIGDLAHEPGRALCRWGEAGWGEIAMDGKHDGAFDPRLVEASADLIRNRWRPAPKPVWLTWVPSALHPNLVPQFAVELAKELGIPWVDAVQKVKSNQPQKTMESTDRRCRNLDGVFEIRGDLRGGPVLLIDDAVDSGWTFAVIAALLRRAGSGPVFPFAIMSTATSS